MGCGSSALGCGPEGDPSAHQPGPTSPPSPPPPPPPLETSGDSAAAAAAEPEPKPAVGVTVSEAGLRHSSAAAAATEELACGRSQLERGYQQLPLGLPLKEWDDLHVRMWLLTLPAVLRPYTDVLCSPGGLLLEWSDELLTEAGVGNAFHRKQLLEYVRQLQSDVAARLEQQQLHQRQQHRKGPPAALAVAVAAGGVLPGSIASPSGAAAGICGPKQGRRDSDPGLASLTSPRRASLRRLCSAGSDSGARVGGGGGAEGEGEAEAEGDRGGKAGGGGGGGGAARRASKEAADVLAEYEVGALEQGVSALKLLVRQAGALCPWPGDAAAKLLGELLGAGERALVNKRNWHQLNVRAVDLLQLIAANKSLQADTQTYRSIMHRLINTLKGIQEYFTDYTGRNWLSRIMGAGRDQHMFNQLWNALGALVADASLGLQVAEAGGQQATREALERLQRRQARYDDEEGRLRRRVEELGGVDGLMGDPAALLAVAQGLGLGTQLTLHKIQEAVCLLEADRCEGVHSLIPHPELRVMWRKCFAGLQDVGWGLWWEAFPRELSRVPVEGGIVSALTSRLSQPHRRTAFQRRMDLSSSGRISVVDLRRTVPPDADLQEAVAQLTERLSDDGEADLPSTATAAAAATVSSSSGTLSAGTAGAGGAAAAAAEPRPTASPAPPSSPSAAATAAPSSSLALPYRSLEPRCSLPPLDSDRFVGREEDVRQVAEILMAGALPPPQNPLRLSRRGSSGGAAAVGGACGSALAAEEGVCCTAAAAGFVAAAGDGGGGGAGRNLGLSLGLGLTPPRPLALCVVAESGMGKSALAVAAARRLWGGGWLPGGAYWVDCRGADCRAEVAARFAGALGVGKAEHGDAAGTAGVSLALQALAARGALLLVLDGVDCLDDNVYGSFGCQSVAVAAAADANDDSRLDETADSDVVQNDDGGGGGGGLGSAGVDVEPEAALSELLSVVPSARVLLTSTTPLELRAREVEHWWLGPLPEPAGGALVQELARCLSWDEARQLASACGLSPLALRLAASAVASGALTLRDAMARARNATATATAAVTPRSAGGVWSPGGGGAAFSPRASVPGSVVGPSGRGVGPSILVPPTPRLLRSQSQQPSPSLSGRYHSPRTPPSRVAAAAAAPPYGFMRSYADGSAPGSSPSPGAGGAGGYGTYGMYGMTLSSAVTPSPGGVRRANNSFGRSMSFLLRASASQTMGRGGGGGAAAAAAASIGGGGSSIGRSRLPPPPPPLQTAYSYCRVGSGASDRTYGNGAAVAAALLAALSDEHRTALVQLSIMPGSWDEDTASALLGRPPYAVRALLDVLVGYSLVVNGGCSVRSSRGGGGGGRGGGAGGLGATMGGGGGGGGYRLMPGVLDAARAMLAEMDAESKVALQCRFVGHVLSQFLRADRLYKQGAVRAAMQLASELRQDVQAMLLVAARCSDPERMVWGTLGASRLAALAASRLFSGLVLEASGEMEAFWRAVQEAAEAEPEAAVPEAAATVAAAAATTASSVRRCRDGVVAALAARALAQTLHKQARLEEAEVAWRGALQQAQLMTHGSAATSLEVAACHSGLGLALSALQRFGEAEEQAGEALRLRRAALGDHHAEVAASLSDLARLMRLTGRYAEAEEAYRRVLQLRVDLLGEDHPAVADSYNSAGITAGLMKRHLEEEHCYRRALAIRQRTLGPDHPGVAQALNNIGTALSSQGRHEAAEQVFREALAIKRRVLGPTHHAVGTTLNNVARALRYQGKLPEAEAACREALGVMEAALGPMHPSVTTAASNLVHLLRRLGKDDEAEAVHAAYRPRWTRDLVDSAQPTPGQQGQQGQGQPRVDEAMAAVAASPPPRSGKSPLAAQGSGSRTAPPQPPPRKQQQQQHLAEQAPKAQAEMDAALALMAGGSGPQGRPEGPALGGGGGGAAGVGSVGSLGGGGGDLTAGAELSSRLDASSFYRRALVEAARAVQRELQGEEVTTAAAAAEKQHASGGSLRPRTSGPLGSRSCAGSTTPVADFVSERESTSSSSFNRRMAWGALELGTSTETLSTNGTNSMRLSGTMPPRPHTAAPALSGATKGEL